MPRCTEFNIKMVCTVYNIILFRELPTILSLPKILSMCGRKTGLSLAMQPEQLGQTVTAGTVGTVFAGIRFVI